MERTLISAHVAAAPRVEARRDRRFESDGSDSVLVMVAFIKSVTFDCDDVLVVARFWAAALGSNVDEDGTAQRAWVEPAGWGGPTLWFQQVPEKKSAKNRQHFDLRAVGDVDEEVNRLRQLGAQVLHQSPPLVVMTDPEGNEFCVEA